MSTKQQAMQAKKQAKRAKNKKKAAVAKKTPRPVDKAKAIQGALGQGSIYDLINNVEKLKGLAEAGIAPSEEDAEIDRKEFMKGVASTADSGVFLHAGVEMLKSLQGEKKITLSQTDEDMIEVVDRTVVSLCEDLVAIKLLDKAGKQPVDYIEIVLHVADVAQLLVGDLRDHVIALLDRYDSYVETYAKEHKAPDMDMTSYMEVLHNRRMQVVAPLYRSKAGRSTDDILNQAAAEFEEVPDDEPVNAFDNLPREPVLVEGESVQLDVPNDPIHQ